MLTKKFRKVNFMFFLVINLLLIAAMQVLIRATNSISKFWLALSRPKKFGHFLNYLTFSFFLLILMPSSSAQTAAVTTIESLGTIPVTQPLSGLGFGIDSENEWEFQMAAAAGATHVRIGCDWRGIETQTAPPQNKNMSTQYNLSSSCASGIQLSKKYGMDVDVLAAYGPPFHTILNVTMPSGAAAGAKSIDVQFASGVGGDTLSSLAPFYDYIMAPSNAQITNKWSYAGGLITNIELTDATHATLTLASAISTAIPVGATTKFIINEQLYPSAATTGPTDPSVLAFARYAKFLASSIAAAGATGEVELWNEPPWAHDPWDDRADFYDVFPGAGVPGPTSGGMPNFGFAAALQADPNPVRGVTYNWAGTEKSGASSLLLSRMYDNTGVYVTQPATIVTAESFHPYGNTPEDALWSANCLAASIHPYPTKSGSAQACDLINPGSTGSNAVQAVQASLVQQTINPNYGISHNITETGLGTGDNAHKARFIMRQFLGFQSAGVTPIDFYKFYDPNFGFVSSTPNANGTYSPLPSLTAISGLMADLQTIKEPPVTSYSTATLPSIVSYSGTYPLDTVDIVGSRTGDNANSVFLALWQRSNGANWPTAVASPPATPVTVQIPTGMSVSAVLNLDTRATVSYITSGNQITFPVSDDPIEVLVDPVAPLTEPVPSTFFGLSDLHFTVDPTSLPFGVMRSWDNEGANSQGLGWSSSNTFPGVYNFTALDSFIAFGQAHNSQMLYTFGVTPRWASSQPNSILSPYGVGLCAPPSNLANWDNYVRAVVIHAAGRIKYWELWNEAQNPEFYCGSIPTLVLMAQHAYTIIKSLDPTAVVLSPSVVGSGSLPWLTKYMQAGGSRYADIIAFHAYTGQTAESIVPVVQAYESFMQANGLANKPLWDTESSWGNGSTPTLTTAQEAGFVAKYYLLHWSLGVSNFTWYGFDAGVGWGQLWNSTNGLSPAGTAYAQTYNWMVGATMISPCSEDGNSIWACTLTKPNGYQAQATWITNSSMSVTVPSIYTQYRDLTGTVYPITNNTVTIGDQPVLLENQSP